MHSGVPAVKKTAICRYFANSGSCFYGDECQFLHEPASNGPQGQGRTRFEIGGEGNARNAVAISGEPGPTMDANNGDQYFSATFNNITGNEFQEFPQFNQARPGRAMRGGVEAKPFLPAGGGQDQQTITNEFAALNIDPGKTGLKAGATEFVPKASLPHSNSTPSFAAYNQSQGAFHPRGIASAPGVPPPSQSIPPHPQGMTSPAPQMLPPTSQGVMPPVSQGMMPPMAQGVMPPVSQAPGHVLQAKPWALGTQAQHAIHGGQPISAGASPVQTPTGSPLARRRNKSPVPPLQTSPQEYSGMHLQENVGGTTYFYTQEEAAVASAPQRVLYPNYAMYPCIPPHTAHMRIKSNMPSFFMGDELKMEILYKHAVTMCQIETDELPPEVDNYHNLVPLEPAPLNPLQKSSTFGYPTTCYKAVNTKDGMTYCLRRIHGFRLVHTKCMDLIDLWKKIQHANIVQLRQVFTTKAFGDHSMVFVYDFHPRAETLMARHFSSPSAHMNGYSSPYNLDGTARPYSAGKGNSPRQHAGLLPESLIWSCVVQLSSALRTIHAQSLACRVMDPTKILVMDKTRLRLNCVGIFDILSFDGTQATPLAMMPHYQQEDLVSLGKVVLALACNSVIGIQREHIQTSLQLVARNYSADLKNLILYLLTNQQRMRSVNDIMPMIGARFYTQLDASLLRNDTLENDLAKEIECGRLFRLLSKFSLINERPEFNMDPTWSETGDRYMLKLFRDYLFHQVDEHGYPWVDMAHIVQSLNKLEAGVPEKVCLMSRDEQSVIVVTYTELKRCFESAINELLSAGRDATMT